jgi:UDP-glucose 4-epimerase
MTRILVTGGAGFIGSHLVDAFVTRRYEVLVIDNLSTGSIQNLNAKCSLEVCDICSKCAFTTVKAFAPQILCHQAAQMDIRKSVRDPAADAETNIVGLVNVLEASRTADKLQYVLFASSGGAIYGEQEIFPAPEEHRLAPTSPYGLAKAAGEGYLDFYHRIYGISYVALRYGNVYGPRQTPHGEAGVVSIFLGRLLDQKPLFVYGDGEQTRDFVFIDDVVKANLLALDHRLVGAFNVGTGSEVSINTIASALKRVTGLRVPNIYAEPRQGEQKRSVIDPRRLEMATGFRPQARLEDALFRTFEAVKSNHAWAEPVHISAYQS